ncbi:glutathione S-transferase family protein [Tistrella bauzanensis]|uniref:Glutathione S-transferase family protein n=1 Tax=Tistrella arctica TaxID=3133430 RepID=A0ABU9YQD5_9PROT
MLKIYGTSGSRTSRNLWLAEELGLPYEHLPVAIRDVASHPEITAINPARQIPVIDDDGVVVAESMAINLYLAAKHGGPLAPRDAAETGHIAQWTFWVVTHVEVLALTVLGHRVFFPADRRDPAKADEAEAALARPLAVLEGALARGDGWLVGGRFTVADLNVAAIIAWLVASRADLAAFPNVTAWVRRCRGRDAAKKAQKLP